MEDKALRRAGLDYHEYAQVRIWPNLDQCLKGLSDSQIFAFSTRGSQRYDQVSYRQGDALLFGPETRGLPTAVLEEIPSQRRLRLPMKAGSRSLNLSNSVAVALFEAWRQLNFIGADA